MCGRGERGEGRVCVYMYECVQGDNGVRDGDGDTYLLPYILVLVRACTCVCVNISICTYVVIMCVYVRTYLSLMEGMRCGVPL